MPPDLPEPLRQQSLVPYPLSDPDRIASLERQLAAAISVPLDHHLHDLQEAQLRFDDERNLRYTEVAAVNDRRITELAAANNQRLAEVAEERSKALEIKQIADAKALELAAEIQTYKDQQADHLRDVSSNAQGNRAGRDQIMTWIFGSGMVGAVLAGLITYFVTRR